MSRLDAYQIVDFDLDYGPKITTTYPSVSLSAAEEGNMYGSPFVWYLLNTNHDLKSISIVSRFPPNGVRILHA